VAAGRLIAAGSAASKQTAKLLAINPGWLLYPMGSVTTGRARPAEQLGVELPVPIRVTEYRLRHGHSQTDGRWRVAIHKPMAVGGTRVVGSGMRVGRSAGGSS